MLSGTTQSYRSTHCKIPFIWHFRKCILICSYRTQISGFLGMGWETGRMGERITKANEETFGVIVMFPILIVVMVSCCMYTYVCQNSSNSMFYFLVMPAACVSSWARDWTRAIAATQAAAWRSQILTCCAPQENPSGSCLWIALLSCLIVREEFSAWCFVFVHEIKLPALECKQPENKRFYL